jgi:Holliday junction resolvase RusA-like endonuclease
MRVDIKPLSNNESWTGRRFKSQKYKVYEKQLLLILPKIIIPDGKLQINYIVGYSNKMSDVDNFVKNFQDILSKKYGFNDNMVYRLEVDKVITKKGEEFIDFEIKQLTL